MPFDQREGESLTRAYSMLVVKASEDEYARTIEGIATTPAPDRVGDIVDPMGARFAKSAPLLWQHDHGMPVGEVRFGKPTPKGISFTASIKKPKPDYPEKLRERLEEAWVSVRDGLVKAVSIGFRVDDYEMISDTGGLKFTSYEIIELSLVTIPANAEATINTIKSIDRKQRAASGDSSADGRIPARARASTKRSANGGNPMTTLSERISALEAEKANLKKALLKFDVENMDETDEERFDEIEAELLDVSKRLDRLHRQEAIEVEKDRKPVVENKSISTDAPRDRRTTVLGPNKNIPKGVNFARYVMCLGMARGDELRAAEYAEKFYSDDARIANYAKIKAAAPAAYTGDSGGWAEDIAEAQTVAGEFIEFLRPMTIVDRLADRMRRVPFNVKVSRMTTGQAGYWVGEALPTPMTSGVFDTVTLGKTKVGSIAALSKEQMRFSNINAEATIRDDLARAIVAKLDATFVSTAAASAGVSPAGLLNGVTAIDSAGDTADNVRTDLINLYEPFSAANIPWSSLAYVTTENLRYALMVMKSTLGVREFPDVTNGTLDGQPLIASNHVGGGDFIAISPENILLADDGEVSVEFSDQASLEMLDGSLQQNATSGTGASLVSLWQNGLVGIKIERFVNWAKARSAAVAYIGDATYQGAATA